MSRSQLARTSHRPTKGARVKLGQLTSNTARNILRMSAIENEAGQGERRSRAIRGCGMRPIFAYYRASDGDGRGRSGDPRRRPTRPKSPIACLPLPPTASSSPAPRIARPELDFAIRWCPSRRRRIEESGRTNLADFLVQSPALLGSRTGDLTGGSNPEFGESGLDLLDLRNLGTDRTLVLVDGRRHVSAVAGSAGGGHQRDPDRPRRSGRRADRRRLGDLRRRRRLRRGQFPGSSMISKGSPARGQIGISELGDGGQPLRRDHRRKEFRGRSRQRRDRL